MYVTSMVPPEVNVTVPVPVTSMDSASGATGLGHVTLKVDAWNVKPLSGVLVSLNVKLIELFCGAQLLQTKPESVITPDVSTMPFNSKAQTGIGSVSTNEQVTLKVAWHSQLGIGNMSHCCGNESVGQIAEVNGVIGPRGEQNFAKTSSFAAANT